MTSTLYMGLFYKLVIKKLLCSDWIQDFINAKKYEVSKKFGILKNPWIKWILLVFLVLSITIFVAVDSKGQERVIALLGIFSIIISSVLLTENPEQISFQILFVGLSLNYTICLCFQKWPQFAEVAFCIRNKIGYQHLNETLVSKYFISVFYFIFQK